MTSSNCSFGNNETYEFYERALVSFKQELETESKILHPNTKKITLLESKIQILSELISDYEINTLN